MQNREFTPFCFSGAVTWRNTPIMEVLENSPGSLEIFDEKLFCELIDKIIVQSNTKIRFRLINGLELTESIERRQR